MRPATAINDNVFDFQALLHPGIVFEHPKDVVAHPDLTLAEKRAILASWASDASAIASCPALRAPAGLKAPVSIDAILEALCDLDVPAMIHVAASCNVCHHGTGAHYLNADTSVFMQLL